AVPAASAAEPAPAERPARQPDVEPTPQAPARPPSSTGSSRPAPSEAPREQAGNQPPRASSAIVEVTGVSVRREAGRSRIEIMSEGPVRLRGEPMVLADPPRLVLDLEGARLGAATVDYPADGALVKSVRMAQHTADVVRIAIDLTSPVGYELRQDAETGQLAVVLRHAVSAVYWIWGAGGRGQLWVEMSGMAAVRTATLSDPLRLVVDIQQATLVTSPGEWEVSSGPVRRFRVSQFQPDVVRIVLEVAQPIQPRIVTSLDLTRALLESDPGKAPPAPTGDMDLVLDVYSRITAVTVQPIGPQGAAVVVQATAPIEPRTFYLRNPGRLVLDLPGAVVDPGLDREQQEQYAGVGPAVSVRVGQFLPRSARVVVELRQPVGYQLFSADARETLVLALGDRPLTGRTVAIDAGHGGHDPGAIGASGTPEKVYNLDIAQRLATLLESVGVEVSMSRRTDVYVGLDDRVAVAVKAGADVFVSVHNNASTSRRAVGTEVFYSPNDPASQRLAELLYDSLLDKLDRPARGVRMRRDLRVLRLAPMPAALVEVAFVDNPEDEGRLRDPSFRQQAAEAMFAAIVSFLSQVGNDTVGTARIPVVR
ncbi:MAG: N-acetylmuramoyl-L-alanine amidase, partial [Firmicutes bacterium]|nr:N-acetylmuramoyl-L-alanine amidase [Bacillota bacterium]